MADAIQIDAKVFFERLGVFLNAWKADKRSGDTQFGGADSIVILTGKSEPENSFVKNNALHFWLLGYEFPATLLVFTTGMMYVVTTEKKAKHLQNLKDGKVPVEILPIDAKKPETRSEAFEKCLDIIKGAGKKVGTLPKIETTGPFADEWKKLFGEASKDVEEVDVSAGLSQSMAIKDEEELKSIRTGARAASAVMSDYWVDEMAEVLDSEKKVTHASLAAKINAKIDDQKFFKKLTKLDPGFDNQHLDWGFGPIVQSGGQYDLKMSAQANNDNLHSGCIIAGLGFRYRTYSSVIARTYLIDPSKSQTANYRILLAAHEAAIRAAKEGAACKDVYNAAYGVIKAKKSDLEKHFPKNVGAAVGIELKDNNLTLSGKNGRQLKDGMTLSIITSLADLTNDKPQDKKGTNYSLLLMDTVRVGRGDAVVFTKDASTDLDSIEFYFKDDEEEVKPKQEKKKAGASAIVTSNIKSSRTRGANRVDSHKEEDEARRRAHQKELAERKQREGLERFSEATGALNGEDEKKFKKFESYKRDSQLPARIKDMIVWVDVKALTVILPIMGRPVPFHINTIKNVSKSDEGEYTHLRFNFLSPGQGVGRKDDQPFEDPSAHFIRSLTVRSKDQDRLAEVTSQITELRKAATRKDQEKKEMEDVVEQEKLVEIRNRRPLRMGEVYLRPALEGKRVSGEVEIHQNGLRYLGGNNRSDNVDIVFSNVKHLFFQPCVGELIVLIHVHLKDPILVGKRKTKDVQFYREATDMAFDETGNRRRKHRYGDEEEFEQEQEERRRRNELDKQFKSFAEKISDAGREWNITVDIPFRELSFNGVPHRSNVLMAPATDALVQLTEPPFTVVTLEEIEVCHLERIQFGLKNFDMVFVYKDYNRTPIHINTIPVDQLDKVKEWLDSVDIAYTEGPLNLNWSMIMKTVIADPHQFFKDGGWSFLNTDSDDENAEEESEEESAFEMSDEELVESASESEDESEFDDDASASDDEGDAESDLSEEGEDWDAMEQKAAKADRNGGVKDEEDGAKKRKRR